MNVIAMKKRRYIFVLLLLFVSVAAIGCSNSSDSNSQTAAENSTRALTQSGAPDRRFDMQGIVKSIIGNEVTVNIVIGEQAELSEEEKAKRRAERQNMSPEERQQSREANFKVTNETKSVIIPVGVPIVMTQNNTGTPEVTKMELADIKKGSVLKIWIKSGSTSEEVEFVQISNSGV